MLRSPSIRRSHVLGIQRRLRPIEKYQGVWLPQLRDASNNKINLGSSGSTLGVATATGSPVYVGERGLRLPGVDGNYASAPDSAAISVTGDLEIWAWATLDDWTPAGSNAVIVAKFDFGGSNKRSYVLSVALTTGVISLVTSSLGTGATSITDDSTVATGATDGSRLGLKVTRDAGTGEVIFYTTADPPDTQIPTWAQLGDAVAGTAQAIHDNDTQLVLGTNYLGTGGKMLGNIHRVVIKDGIDGTVVFDADFTKVAGGATSFTEDSSNAATVTINQSGLNPARIIDGPTDVLNGTDASFLIDDNSILDVTATDSFVALFAGRSYDINSGTDQYLFTKRAAAGGVGWILRADSVTTVDALVYDGVEGPGDTIASPADGAAFVAAALRDVGADTIGVWLDGVSSGSPTTDSTTGTMANDGTARIGVDHVGGLRYAGEHFGSAFYKPLGPAPTAAEVTAASRQLAAATGRFI